MVLAALFWDVAANHLGDVLGEGKVDVLFLRHTVSYWESDRTEGGAIGRVDGTASLSETLLYTIGSSQWLNSNASAA